MLLSASLGRGPRKASSSPAFCSECHSGAGRGGTVPWFGPRREGNIEISPPRKTRPVLSALLDLLAAHPVIRKNRAAARRNDSTVALALAPDCGVSHGTAI